MNKQNYQLSSNTHLLSSAECVTMRLILDCHWPLALILQASGRFNQGITAFKFVIWGGISLDIRSEILFYGDASATLLMMSGFRQYIA